jgi:sporulation protein YlmC with PRC-barrel domain
MLDKKPFKALLNKLVVTKEGKKLGLVKDITFEVRSGELIHLVMKESSPYTRNLNLETTKHGELLVPYSALIAIGDFIVISEEEIV